VAKPFGGSSNYFAVVLFACKTHSDSALATVISMVETLDFRPSSSLIISSVLISIFLSLKPLMKARRRSSTVSTALLIARPLALTHTSFAPVLKTVRQAVT